MAAKDQTNKEKALDSIGYAKAKVSKMLVMIEHDDDVMEIIHESKAARRALKQADRMIIKRHLEKVVYEQRHHTSQGTVRGLLSLLKFWLD